MPLTTYTAGEVLTAASLNANFSFAALGKVGQVLSTTLSSTFTTSSTSFTDVTGLTVSITPTANTSKIFVVASFNASNDAGSAVGGIRLARSGTAILVGDAAGSRTLGQIADGPAAESELFGLSVLDSPASTSALTYSVQVMSVTAGTFFVNRSKTDTNANTFFRGASSITVMEILA